MNTETVTSQQPLLKNRIGVLNIIRSASTLPRSWKNILIGGIDAACVVVALWLSLGLRLNTYTLPNNDQIQIFLGVAVLTVLVNLVSGLYRTVIRRSGDALQFKLLRAAVISGLLVIAVDYMDYGANLPRSTFVIYTFIFFAFTTVTRACWKSISPLIDSSEEAKKIAIYGAGIAGQQLLEVIRKNNLYKPIAFIDSAVALHGIEISGLRVYAPNNLASINKTHNIENLEILLAIPSAPIEERNRLADSLRKDGYKVKTIPGLDELIQGKSIGQLSEVEPNDVLSRKSVAPDFNMMRNFVENETILVTGAGGSIGSELCKQITAHNPSKLVILDVSEPALYHIEQALTGKQPNTEIVPILGSVLDETLIDNIFQKHDIDIVFHAAAYKHVPIVEANPLEGARVNIIGTHTVAKAASKFDVSNFVLVSTDKAVRPTNVMGATKRAAEAIIQNFHHKASTTKFSMVRFGNVIGSSGSVVPKFLSQIEKGGPVTITHPEITRYFMTIPEASQLVIQTGAMSSGGEVFLLDMGEPVRIQDLAIKLIELSGSRVKEDPSTGGIEIEYTGLRPGEKLYEELLIEGDNSSTTDHSKIYKAEEPRMKSEKTEMLISDIKTACMQGTPSTIKPLLMTYITDYVPSKH